MFSSLVFNWFTLTICVISSFKFMITETVDAVNLTQNGIEWISVPGRKWEHRKLTKNTAPSKQRWWKCLARPSEAEDIRIQTAELSHACECIWFKLYSTSSNIIPDDCKFCLDYRIIFKTVVHVVHKIIKKEKAILRFTNRKAPIYIYMKVFLHYNYLLCEDK